MKKSVTFNNKIVFNEAETIWNFQKDIEWLVGTSMLKGDKKLNIINQYLWFRLTCTLQVTPKELLKIWIVEGVDKLLQSSTKEILCMPGDTTKSFLYAPKKFKGLKLILASWESFL